MRGYEIKQLPELIASPPRSRQVLPALLHRQLACRRPGCEGALTGQQWAPQPNTPIEKGPMRPL
jgi:hypothetical protein